MSQEEYASIYGKNESIKSDSIKRKERINNIDIELENWKNLKSNSEKMLLELNEQKTIKLNLKLMKIRKILKKLRLFKGQNIQNLENTKKRTEELE